MTVNDLMKTLRKIIKVHPELRDAHLYSRLVDRSEHRMVYIGFDMNHHPPRVTLEE